VQPSLAQRFTAPWRNGRRRGFKSGADDGATDATAENAQRREEANGTKVHDGQPPRGQVGQVCDPVDAALALGVKAAAEAVADGKAGALETLNALTAELAARRRAHLAPGVVRLEDERRKRR
jgi:hypothetical protein